MNEDSDNSIHGYIMLIFVVLHCKINFALYVLFFKHHNTILKYLPNEQPAKLVALKLKLVTHFRIECGLMNAAMIFARRPVVLRDQHKFLRDAENFSFN